MPGLGATPVLIMAMLFVELRQEVLSQQRRARGRLEKDRRSKEWVPTAASITRLINSGEDNDRDDDDDDNIGSGLLNKITDRRGRKQLEMDMHHRLRAYNDIMTCCRRI